MDAINSMKDPVILKEAVDAQIVLAVLGLTLSLITVGALLVASSALGKQIPANELPTINS